MQQVGEISELSSRPCRGRRRDGDGGAGGGGIDGDADSTDGSLV